MNGVTSAKKEEIGKHMALEVRFPFDSLSFTAALRLQISKSTNHHLFYWSDVAD